MARWRDLPPVEEVVEVPERVSQTFLRTHDRCERAAFLYAKHEGGAGSHQLDRGSLYHAWIAKALRHAIANDERITPPDIGKDLLLEAIAENPELVVPALERDRLRAMVFNTCEAFEVDPAGVIAVESAFTLKLGKWTIRGRIDLAELSGPARIDVTDWKTSWPKSQDEFEETGFWQTQLYALGLAFGELEETGLSLGQTVEEFRLIERYPRIVRSDGELAYRDHVVSRQQLLDFKLDVEAQLLRLEQNIETGKWQPVPGAQCAQCTAPAECPLPRHLRPDSQLNPATMEDAQKIAEWIFLTRARTKNATARLKKWAMKMGIDAIPVGDDHQFEFVYREAEEIKNRDELWLGVEGAVEYGHDFKREDHVTSKRSTKFELRRRRASEGES